MPFLLKFYERLWGVMSICPRAAAARRRRGVLARAAYAMRKERYADVPRLPLARAGSIGDVLTLSPAPPDVSQGARARAPDSESRRKKRRRRQSARPARSARSGLPPPRHVLANAEVGAALDFYDDLAHVRSMRGSRRAQVTNPSGGRGAAWLRKRSSAAFAPRVQAL